MPMALGSEFHSPHFGRERLAARASIPRHRHWDGYITVVVAGGYQEAGFDGRWNLTAGDVVVHRRNDAHLDHIGPKGVDLVNLPLPSGLALPAAFRIEDPDSLARLAERSPFEAALAIRPSSEIAAQSDWPDKLALDLMTNCGQRLGHWAAAMGLAAETLSRGFRAAYGVTPARYRAERRARQAIEMIVQSDAALASIAADCGYADQSHLNREIVALTGRSPGRWRRSNSFKNGKRASA
jgi:AraC-like DNA-binding protein